LLSAADIPLHKCNDSNLKEFIAELKCPAIPTPTSKFHMNKLAVKRIFELVKYFENEKVYIVIDESGIKGKIYMNTLTAKLEPRSRYFFD
jgi:DUF1009 family protein